MSTTDRWQRTLTEAHTRHDATCIYGVRCPERRDHVWAVYLPEYVSELHTEAETLRRENRLLREGSDR